VDAWCFYPKGFEPLNPDQAFQIGIIDNKQIDRETSMMETGSSAIGSGPRNNATGTFKF
jgi:hypothetical protein